MVGGICSLLGVQCNCTVLKTPGERGPLAPEHKWVPVTHSQPSEWRFVWSPGVWALGWDLTGSALKRADNHIMIMVIMMCK